MGSGFDRGAQEVFGAVDITGIENPPEKAGFFMANRRSLFEVAQGRGVEATVHVHDFAADAGRQVRAQEGAGVADFFDGDVATQWGLRFVGGQHLAEVLDAGSGEGADGT